jgi:hypothetical protein
MACGPKFFVEFSAPPEFSGGVTEKFLCTGWARPIDLQITKQILYHCASASLYLYSYNIYLVVARIFRPFLKLQEAEFSGRIWKLFAGIFRPYLQLLAAEFSGRIRLLLAGIFRPYLQLLEAEFSGRICSYLAGFSGLTFPGTRRPGFSGRICCFWPGFSGRSFSGMGNLKKLYGQPANCSGIYSGIFCS